jgi:hypothetical protein
MRFVASTASGANGPNEDYVAATSDLLVVLDGATVRTDTGCQHGVAWFARRLGGAILGAAAQRSTSLPTVLATAIEQVAQLHPECDLTHPGTPSAAVGIVRQEDNAVHYLVLGDVTVVIDAGGPEPVVISDERVSATAAAERARADRWPIGAPEKQTELVAMKHAELAARNQPGGYWIAAADPTVVDQAITGELPNDVVNRFAVATDGAARLVVMFGRHTWSTALDLLEFGGPDEVIRQVRAAETDDPAGELYPRNKVSDDATIAFAVPEPVRHRVRQNTWPGEARQDDVLAIAKFGRLFGAVPTVDGRLL